MQIDYKKIRLEKYRENRDNVLKDIDTPEMKLKIANWANLHSFTEEEVRAQILTNEMFRCLFAKDPSKQNFAENAFRDFLKNISGAMNVRKLPGVGKNALYIKEDGSVIQGLELEKDSLTEYNSSKSIDFNFDWKSKTDAFYKIYITHKYTNEEGGAQDNQYEDAKKFLKNAKNNNDKNSIFLAILDGEYYLNHSRLDVPNLHYGVENKILAMTSDHIEGFLNSLP